MNRFRTSMLPAVLAACLFLALSACQPAPRAVTGDSGLIPAPGSTGNPPLIPHDVDAADSGVDCLGCHKDGEDEAPKIPEWHAGLVDCRECHIRIDEESEPFEPHY